MTKNEAIIEFQNNIDLPFGFSVSDEASEMAIKALNEKEQIENLLKCHNDFSVETAQINYELVKAIRVILGIDERH